MEANAAAATPAVTGTAITTARTPLLVLALLAVDGLHFVFARLLHDHLPPLAAVSLVMLVATLEIGIPALATKRLHLDAFVTRAPFFLAIGFLVGLSTSINYIAVGFIDPGAASLLSQSSIVFGLTFGLAWFHDRLTRTQLAGAVLCLIGVAVITFQPGDYFRLGSLMVVGGSLVYALHAALVKRYGGGLDFVEFFFWRVAMTACFVLLAAAAQGEFSRTALTVEAVLLVLLVGTVDVIISRALYYLALRRLPISIHTLVFTLSPIVASIWALALFGTLPSAQQVLGGVIVLVGVLIVSMRRA